MIPLLERRSAKWPPEWQEELAERLALMQEGCRCSEDEAHLNAFYWVGFRMDRANDTQR